MTVTTEPRSGDRQGAWRIATARFPALPAAIPQARRFVRRHVDDAALVERALLLVSELATNALEHAGSAFEVTVVTGTDRVRVEVVDASHRPPMVTYRPLEAEHGRGLRIVQGLAEEWGVDARPDGDGKVVWFELRRPGPGELGRRRRTG